MYVVVYQGEQSSREVIRKYEWENLSRAVVLTTYEILVRDSKQLQPLSWKLLVVDEAHR